MRFLAIILTQMRQAVASFTSFLLDYRPKFKAARSHFAPILPFASIQRYLIVVFLPKTAERMLNLGQLFSSIPSLYRLRFLVLPTKEARCPLHLT
jgi:hypothetical protein